MPPEQELKYALSNEKDYLKLLSKLPCPEKEIRQTNYFLKAPFLEADPRKAFRVRVTPDATFITVKQGGTFKDGYFTTFETELCLDKNLAIAWQDWLKNPTDPLPAIPEEIREALGGNFDLNALSLLGSFTNLRIVVPSDWGRLEIDKTSFKANRIDYELELETTNPEISKEITAFLEENKINYKPQTETKFHRFKKNLDASSLPNNEQ